MHLSSIAAWIDNQKYRAEDLAAVSFCARLCRDLFRTIQQHLSKARSLLDLLKYRDHCCT